MQSSAPAQGGGKHISRSKRRRYSASNTCSSDVFRTCLLLAGGANFLASGDHQYWSLTGTG